VKDSEIFEEIIAGYGLQSEVEATTVTHLEMVQHHVTDWDFLVSRAEVNGKLVFVDDGKITVKAPIFQLIQYWNWHTDTMYMILKLEWMSGTSLLL
jgi:hypothetical protein